MATRAAGRALAWSSGVTIADVGGSRGRGLIATEALRAGQVIVQESPIAWMRTVDDAIDHGASGVCAHCLALTRSTGAGTGGDEAIGGGGGEPHSHSCPECGDLFCSHACYEAAAALYHRRECGNSGLARLCEETPRRFPVMISRLVALIMEAVASGRDAEPLIQRVDLLQRVRRLAPTDQEHKGRPVGAPILWL